MRSCNLILQLRVSLGEAFRDNVIHEAITVGQCMPGLAASKARVGMGLVMRHHTDEKIHFLFSQ
jgi:hypothetical protein